MLLKWYNNAVNSDIFSSKTNLTSNKLQMDSQKFVFDAKYVTFLVVISIKPLQLIFSQNSKVDIFDIPWYPNYPIKIVISQISQLKLLKSLKKILDMMIRGGIYAASKRIFWSVSAWKNFQCVNRTPQIMIDASVFTIKMMKIKRAAKRRALNFWA